MTSSNTTCNAIRSTNRNSNLNSNIKSNRHTNQNKICDRNVGIQPTQHLAIKPLHTEPTEEANQKTARERVTNIDDAVEASSNPNTIATITPVTMVTQHNGKTSPCDITWLHSFNINDTDTTLEEISLATQKKTTKELLREMKRKMDWLTTLLQGTAAWPTKKTNEIADGAELKRNQRNRNPVGARER